MKQIIFITKIDWLDEETREADVCFNLNGQQFRALCHPCTFKSGDMVTVEFDFFEEDISDRIVWSENSTNKKEVIQSPNDPWRYLCYGQIKGINPTVIDCGNITFSYPRWRLDSTAKGAYVYFVISRLDINSL